MGDAVGMDAVFVIYPAFTALDIVGPFQVFSSVPDIECVFVAEQPRMVVDHTGMLTMRAEASLAEVDSPDLVVVPGNAGVPVPTATDPLAEWLRAVHPTTRWTTSVCTGSLYLGAAGILDGLPATTHWAMLDFLRGFGAEPTVERVVFADRVVTSAGVSSGIDMALALVERAWDRQTAEAVQLAIEYDPQPPVDAGAPAKASADATQQASGLLARMIEQGAAQASAR
jgi:transcriptional regulator GlxA family with amidase domain